MPRDPFMPNDLQDQMTRLIREEDPEAANLLTLLLHVATGEKSPIRFVVAERTRGEEIITRLIRLATVFGWDTRPDYPYLRLDLPEFNAEITITVKPEAEGSTW